MPSVSKPTAEELLLAHMLATLQMSGQKPNERHLTTLARNLIAEGLINTAKLK